MKLAWLVLLLPALCSASKLKPAPQDNSLLQSSASCRAAFIRGILFNPDGSPKGEYIGQMEGYPRFAEDHFAGAMQKAFLNASAVLTEKERKLFGWQVFQGPVAEFRAMRGKLFNPDGSPKEKYRGQMEGYPRFAEDHFAGAIQKAFQNASAGLTEKERKLFGWKKFKGHVSQFHSLIEDFLEHYPKGWMGPEGHQSRVADKIFKGNKNTAYMNVSVLGGYLFGADATAEFRALGWRRQR